MKNQEDILDQRLKKIESWAQNNGFILREGGGSGLTKSLLSKNSIRLFTFYHKGTSKGKDKGTMYAYITENIFPGGAKERDTFVDEITNANLYDNNLDAITQISHKHLSRNLQDLNNDELDKLLTILAKYCAKTSHIR